MRISSALLLLSVFAVLLTGCGGNGGETLTTGRATLNVLWPERTRLIPAASNSIRVDILQEETTVASKLIERPAQDGPTTVEFFPLPIGDFTLRATAYPKADGTGTAQAAGVAPLSIQGGQTSDITLTMNSAIARLETSETTLFVGVGTKRQIMVTARDSANAIVLVAPDKLRWVSTNRTVATISNTGILTGITQGSAQITVTDTESLKVVSAAVVVRAPATLTFEAPVSYPVPAIADQVIAADFDGDGKTDVAIGGETRVGILYGTGSGTLNAYAEVLTWQAAISTRGAADLNGDGRIDLICCDNQSRLVILLNSGGRKFADPITLDLGSNATAVVVADFNQDGARDIAALSPAAQSLLVALNRGRGTFTFHDSYPVGNNPQGAVVGDLNGDGYPDVGVGFAGGVKLFYGHGDGSLTESAPVVNFNPASGPMFADFNGDGKLDIGVSNDINNTVSVVQGTGSGQFGPAIIYPVGLTPLVTKAADFDRNGALDILTATAGSNTFSVLQNKGTGLFSGVREFPAGGSGTRSCDVADFNGDGRLDVVVQNQGSKTISIILNATP